MGWIKYSSRVSLKKTRSGDCDALCRKGKSMSEQSNEAEEVIVLTTGGTIEKSYDEFEGSLENRESQIKRRILKKLRLPYTHIRVHSILAKDSLYMTDEDRELLIKNIKLKFKRKAPIVVLHGTDTMEVSARFCYELIPDPPVAVVFTGAMRPMGFEDSDALQNVTEALLAAKLLRPGIYISFHNKIFEVPKVRKNKQKGTFEVIL